MHTTPHLLTYYILHFIFNPILFISFPIYSTFFALLRPQRDREETPISPPRTDATGSMVDRMMSPADRAALPDATLVCVCV